MPIKWSSTDFHKSALLIDDNSLVTIDRGQLHVDQLSLVAIGAMNRRDGHCAFEEKRE